jgi:serine protease AprX
LILQASMQIDVEITKEVQSYTNSVEEHLSLYQISVADPNNVSYDQVVQNQIQNLEFWREQLEKTIQSPTENLHSLRWRKFLLRKLERSSRRLSLGLPQNISEFLAALKWISQKGKDSRELDLIQTIRVNPRYNTSEIRNLLDIAETNIREKLKYKYRVFCNPTQNLGKIVEVVHRYTAFTIVVGDECEIAQLQQYYPIERLSSASPEEFHMPDLRDQKVRFTSPIKEEWKQKIEAIGPGVKILRPLGPDMLVVSVVDAVSLEHLRQFKEIEEITPYVPNIQIHSQYFEQLGQESTEEAINTTRFPATDEPISELAVPAIALLIANFFTTIDRDQAEQTLSAQGIQIVSRPGKSRLIIDLSEHPRPKAAITSILRQLGLRSLEEKIPEIPFNDVARGVIAGGVIPSSPSIDNTLGLTGKGEIIAVADTGLDTGEEATIHIDFQGRIHSIQSFPIADGWSNKIAHSGVNSGAADYSGHGTHVSGTLVGGGEQAQALGLPPVQGMAPDAKLIVQSIAPNSQWISSQEPQLITQNLFGTGTLSGIPDDLEDLFQPAYKLGARIHSNSWGAPVLSKYTDRCEQLDAFVWEQKDFLVVVAAGNEGCQVVSLASTTSSIKPMSLASPGVAKNCLTVGASENDRLGQFSTTYGELNPARFHSPPFCDATLVESIEYVAGFSSRGPCKPYQRRKPDVLAPGTFVLSTRSSMLLNRNSGVPYPEAEEYYMYQHGTSMATPLVAGAASLVRQYLRQYRSIDNPSAALLKAIIIHSAAYIPDRCNPEMVSLDNNNLQDRPISKSCADHQQGWGRVNLKTVLNPDSPSNVEFVDHLQGLQTGNQCVFKVKISDPTVPLRITLVYTDYPGEGLINDLNLLVLSPLFGSKNLLPEEQVVWCGNDFRDRSSWASQDELNYEDFDHVNNVEGIVIAKPICGIWEIRVIATSVPDGPQDFALVVSGGQIHLTKESLA